MLDMPLLCCAGHASGECGPWACGASGVGPGYKDVGHWGSCLTICSLGAAIKQMHHGCGTAAGTAGAAGTEAVHADQCARVGAPRTHNLANFVTDSARCGCVPGTSWVKVLSTGGPPRFAPLAAVRYTRRRKEMGAVPVRPTGNRMGQLPALLRAPAAPCQASAHCPLPSVPGGTAGRARLHSTFSAHAASGHEQPARGWGSEAAAAVHGGYGPVQPSMGALRLLERVTSTCHACMHV